MRPFPAIPGLVRFDLSRWFAAVALVSITLLAVTLGSLLDRFMTQRLMWQEAQLTREFVQSLIHFDKPLVAFFAAPTLQPDRETEESLAQIAGLPDMLRANVYDRARRLVWSSDRLLIGRIFGPNDELDAALAGNVVTHFAHTHEGESGGGKAEHLNLKSPSPEFIELYVPVMGARGEGVQAVIEFYRQPRSLGAALLHLRLYIVAGAATSGLLLFGALFGLVWRADRTIRAQQRQLVDNETFAVVGEMSAAVAHGIRNPLASIRSSAELVQDGDLAQAHAAASDIVAQSDRLETWVRELLAYTRPLDGAVAPVLLPPLVGRCMEEFERDMQRRGIRSRAVLAADLPAVRGDALLLGQVLRSLLANAVEAMGRNGEITVRGVWAGSRGEVTLSVEDSGPGMTKAQLERAGKPFHTTKSRGLGIGLALARRVMERFDGRLEIDSRPGRGTIVRLRIPAA